MKGIFKSDGFVMKNLRYCVLTLLTVIMVAFFTSQNANFISITNLMDMTVQMGSLAILSAGATLAAITGNQDLSVGAGVALGGCVGTVVYFGTGGNLLACVVSAVVWCVLVGLLNGYLVGYCAIAPFIATIATNQFLGGTALWITNAQPIPNDNAVLKFVAQYRFFGVVPILLVLIVIIYFIFKFVNDKTVMGKQIYAVGGNRLAAQAMGIDSRWQIMRVYIVLGLLVGLCSLVTLGRLGSAQPTASKGLEFDVLTAVILGGTSLSAGIGSITGTVFGVVLVGVLTNGLNILSINPYYIYFVKGALIVFAVVVDGLGQWYQNKLLTPATEKRKERVEDPDIMALITNDNDKTIEMNNITKAFPGMKAIDDVSVSFAQGRIHALVGENGAGKSTLVNILSGQLQMNSGHITINGKNVSINSPLDARKRGIAIIHQEFSQVRELTVAQNIFLGVEVKAKVPGFLSNREMNKRTKDVLKRVGVEIMPTRKIKELSVGEQQIVEIARALVTNAWMIVMDEATSALSEGEKENLFSIVRNLKSNGVGIVYITHRLKEIFEICDEITVLRDGKFIAAQPVSEVTEDDLVRMMVGRELVNIFERKPVEKYGKTVLEVKDFTRSGVFKDISFSICEGEVLGLGGLMGAGRTEVARCIFGLDPYDKGEIKLFGEKIHVSKPQDAIDHGIAYVPEDRHREGIVPLLPIITNLAMPSYPRINRFGIVKRVEEEGISQAYIQDLKIKTTDEHKNVNELSGGNQQKVSLGKWLAIHPKLLILDEPTRGIDVGSKAEIHAMIDALAKQGMAILLISSEMGELIGCADNIVVLRKGVITGRFDDKKATQESIMTCAAHTDG